VTGNAREDTGLWAMDLHCYDPCTCTGLGHGVHSFENIKLDV